jgi:putative transposase
VTQNLEKARPRTRTGIARKHTPEAIIGKLHAAEIALALGGTGADAHRRIGVTEPRYDRWRK